MTMRLGDERGEERDAGEVCGQVAGLPVDDQEGMRSAVRVRQLALALMRYRSRLRREVRPPCDVVGSQPRRSR
jgi:hypothetical protein